ncbi:MAG: M28 family peptidase [Acidobacteria bacterium]|nr:M28 family peptidase [Acidobacteriota bacterium]
MLTVTPLRATLILFAAITAWPIVQAPQESASKGKIQFTALPRTTLEERLARFEGNNAAREQNLKKMFSEAGCADDLLTEQRVSGTKIPNVVCTLPGASDSVILIGAHFDYVEAGKGVADNWSGAALLPSLLQSLSGLPRKHTLVFVGFTAEEKGLVGSDFYASHLTKEQKANVRAMINIDTIGLGPTKIWFSHSDKHLIDVTQTIGGQMGFWVQGVNADLVGDEDSTSFRKRKIPTLMIHSITQETFPILHSSKDEIKAIKIEDYEDTYRLVAAVIAYLDSSLD